MTTKSSDDILDELFSSLPAPNFCISSKDKKHQDNEKRRSSKKRRIDKSDDRRSRDAVLVGSSTRCVNRNECVEDYRVSMGSDKHDKYNGSNTGRGDDYTRSGGRDHFYSHQSFADNCRNRSAFINSSKSRREDDTFWDSTWEAMEFQKKADSLNRKGRHYNPHYEESRRKCVDNDYHRSRYNLFDKEDDNDEYIRLKRLKDIQEFVVKDSKKDIEKSLDSNPFEWDERTMMRRRKTPSHHKTLRMDDRKDDDKQRRHRRSSLFMRQCRSSSVPKSRHNKFNREHRRERELRNCRAVLDKKKLLNIAKRNAAKLLNSNNLMGIDHDKLVRMRAGDDRQTLAELTQFCQLLSHKGITNDEGEDLMSLHHPYEIVDRPLPNPFFRSKTSDADGGICSMVDSTIKSHRTLEFPVSSGNAHRGKSELQSSSAGSAEVEGKESIINVKDLAKQTFQPHPVGVKIFNSKNIDDCNKLKDEDRPIVEINDTNTDSVFDKIPDEPPSDISKIVSQRLNALRRLNDNPTDENALQEMHSLQSEISNWVSSKNVPGQFTGHTGAKVLTHAELTDGKYAWPKKEQFDEADKVCGGFGEYLLRKMGWSHGDGLGKDKSGDVAPLSLDIKMDKIGLMSAEEDGGRGVRNRQQLITLTAFKDITKKHPVSALLEYASFRKWGQPNFCQVFECGPPHQKQYIFKVVVNGVDYQPTVASIVKKKAKADAAIFALQELGLIAKDPNNPL